MQLYNVDQSQRHIFYFLFIAGERVCRNPFRAEFRCEDSAIPQGYDDFGIRLRAEDAGRQGWNHRGRRFASERRPIHLYILSILILCSKLTIIKISASKSVMKILDISDTMVATMAGGAADCQFWTRIVAKYCRYIVDN